MAVNAPEYTVGDSQALEARWGGNPNMGPDPAVPTVSTR